MAGNGRSNGSGPVLVIEHDEATRDLLADVLRGDGRRVLTASGGDEGWNMALMRPPSLLITGVAGLDGDGWEVVRRFHADDTLSATPIVVISAVPPEPAAPEPVDGYLVKPLRAGEVSRTVSALIGPGPEPGTGPGAEPVEGDR